ncbi:E3 ubiquitin-protein ligase MARCH11 [Bienertia sinuspersici]
MMGKESQKEAVNQEANSGNSSPAKSDKSRASTASQLSIDRDLGLPACRVCQCVESDQRGDAALGFLGIDPPPKESHNVKELPEPDKKNVLNDVEGNASVNTNQKTDSGYVQFISPTGEVFVCNADLETGSHYHQDSLIELGCACKNDLALVHYACALKWFVNHGSTVCEICGCVASNIKIADYKKVLASLKDYEALRARTVNGVPNPAQVHDNSGVDPDAVAAIRRQRLSEIYLWFNPYGNNHHNHNNSESAPAVMVVAEPPANIVVQDVTPPQNLATKWAVEGTGILLATGLLTVTLAWLIAPRVGKKTAKNGLHILLGGVCALAVVVFFRFIVLTRIRYGPARYWAILFVFWFLVFGIWASRTHAAHTT